jgi:hypothetical protein
MKVVVDDDFIRVDQPLDQMRADEPRPAGNADAFAA